MPRETGKACHAHARDRVASPADVDVVATFNVQLRDHCDHNVSHEDNVTSTGKAVNTEVTCD